MTDLHVEVRAGEEPAVVWGHGLLQASASAPIDPRTLDVPNEIVTYDARNHGRSPDAGHSEELSWPALAADMAAVASSTGHERFVAGGSSMGAATALTLAHRRPECVTALVLAIPPTAWTLRWGQRTLYGAMGVGGALIPARNVSRAARSLRGAARTDLPPLDELKDLDIPTLVLAWRFDPSHPSKVAERLARTIPDSDLLVTRRPADVDGWTDRIEDFLRSLD